MDTAILSLSWVLDKILNPAILILALAEVVIMLKAYTEMKALRKRVDDLNGLTAGKRVLTDRNDKKLTTERVLTSSRDWNEFDRFCDDYQNSSVWFSAFSLIVQIFPLLGILGTVTGLFIAMSGNADWSNAQSLFEGVQFALSSTVLGIFFAVIFKAVDIAFNAKYLGYIDDGVSRFRENYNIEKELPLGGDRE